MKYIFLLCLILFLPSCITVKMGEINPNAAGETYNDDVSNSNINKNKEEINYNKEVVTPIDNSSVNYANKKEIKSVFFEGDYIIKPLWAFSKGKGNEEGENELYIKIIVDGVEKITNFTQNKNLSSFPGANLKFNIKKDSLITIELWDRDALFDDFLLKRIGVIPADLDRNGILTLKDKYSILDIMFIADPKISSNNYILYNISINIDEGHETKASINFPMIFNSENNQLANTEIDKIIPYTLLYSYRKEKAKENISVVNSKYRVIYTNEDLFSIISYDFVDSSQCYETECPNIEKALTFHLTKGIKLTSREIFYRNAYNSNALCKIINREKNKKVLDCNNEKNKNINFNNFAVKKDGIIFVMPYEGSETDGWAQDYEFFLSFEKLKGLINENFLKLVY